MDNNIKPIKTIYKGYRFRSRLEARWAVFFDAYGVEWEYEPEGFDLGDGICYLPDFLLHGVKGYVEGDLYVEVKGHLTDEDLFKIEKFCWPNGNTDTLPEKPLILVGELLYDNKKSHIESLDDIEKWPFYSNFFICGDAYPVIPGINEYGDFGIIHNQEGPYINEEATLEAYRIAKQVCFEHGEAAEIPAIISNFRERFNLGR